MLPAFKPNPRMRTSKRKRASMSNDIDFSKVLEDELPEEAGSKEQPAEMPHMITRMNNEEDVDQSNSALPPLPFMQGRERRAQSMLHTNTPQQAILVPPETEINSPVIIETIEEEDELNCPAGDSCHIRDPGSNALVAPKNDVAQLLQEEPDTLPNTSSTKTVQSLESSNGSPSGLETPEGQTCSLVNLNMQRKKRKVPRVPIFSPQGNKVRPMPTATETNSKPKLQQKTDPAPEVKPNTLNDAEIGEASAKVQNSSVVTDNSQQGSKNPALPDSPVPQVASMMTSSDNVGKYVELYNEVIEMAQNKVNAMGELFEVIQTEMKQRVEHSIENLYKQLTEQTYNFAEQCNDQLKAVGDLAVSNDALQDNITKAKRQMEGLSGSLQASSEICSG